MSYPSILIQTPLLMMLLQSSIEFIDAALRITGSFALSYTEPEQRWYILKDLPSLLQEFPSLSPSVDTFTHNDGTNVDLLKAEGTICVAEISLTIWLHEGYPYAAPMVFVHQDHPIVGPASGAIITPYIATWDYPRCNLVGLARNLVKVLSCDHAFSSSSSLGFSAEPYFVSKSEAVDRLTGMLQSDSIALKSVLEEEIEQLLSLQQEMEKRVETAQEISQALMHEKMKLKRQGMQFAEESDVLINWLKVHNSKKSTTEDYTGTDEAFEMAREECKQKLHCISEDMAIEDTIYALDEAVDQGVLTFEVYIRQVRKLAREQFYYRAVLVKIEKL